MSIKLAEAILWKSIVKNVKYKSKKDLISFLKDIYIFRTLTDWQIGRLSSFLYKRKYEVGDYVFKAGQPGAALFLIEYGDIDIEIERNGQTYTVAQLGEKECLGDMSLIDKSDRSASAKATSPCQIYALHRKDLEKMMETDSDIACKVYRSLSGLIAQRLKAMNDIYEEEPQAEELSNAG